MASRLSALWIAYSSLFVSVYFPVVLAGLAAARVFCDDVFGLLARLLWNVEVVVCHDAVHVVLGLLRQVAQVFLQRVHALPVHDAVEWAVAESWHLGVNICG